VEILDLLEDSFLLVDEGVAGLWECQLSSAEERKRGKKFD